VDILIQAFLVVADRFPDMHLRVIGHCPDRTPFERIARGHPRIHLEKAIHHPQAMEAMARCTAFVLPSRTEAMGRVLLEAMAAGKPVIASSVDGIPFYVQDGETGYLFRSEDVNDLARKLELVLTDPGRASEMGRVGASVVRERYSEAAYAASFQRMVAETITTRSTSVAGGATGHSGHRPIR